jgi:hypothetical protein
MNFASSTIKALGCVNTRKAILALTPAIAVFLICLPLFSQGGQGAIQGGVFDQSGGAVAGAMVTVTDVARGVTRNLTADAAGQYVANSLNPGTYTVRATSKGFKTEEHSGVVVEVDQTIRVDLTLQPGEQTQTITVTGEVPAIDTTDATLGGTVSNAAILSLPLNGRNFQRLLELRPGVVTQVGSGTGFSSTNGRRAGNDVLMVEGIAQFSGSGSSNGILNMVYRGGDSSSLLPIDAIQEFNNEQNPKAEYGWRDGSIISVGVKSGTNSLHGTAYAFGRDAAATDAANPFTQTVTPATLEQFGATAGGRVIKDKIFWFVGYEGLRDALGDVSNATIPVDISLANMLGNGPGGNPGSSLVDACNFLATKAGGGYNPIGVAGPNGSMNGLSAQLTGISIDPVVGCKVSPASSTVENLYPFNPTTSTNYFPNLISTGPLNNGVIKGDYAPGPHHHLSGMYYESKTSQINNYAGGELTPQWEGNVVSDIRMYDGDWTWTPDSSWVIDARLGATYFTAETLPADLNKSLSAPWPTGYGINTGVSNPQYGGFPEIDTNLIGYLGAGSHSSVRGPEGDANFVGNVSYLYGKHAFKFGFDYVDVIFDGNSFNGAQGDVQFTNLENLLSGTINSGSIVVGNADFNARGHWYAPYAQDDWRISTRVTLNLGLRWEYLASPTERNNYLGNFDPNVNRATTPAVQQVGPGEPLPYLYKPNYKGFAPRLGLAWDVQGNGKTVVRAGFGILRDTTPLGPFFSTAPFGASFPDISLNTTGTDANAHTPDTFTLSNTNTNWSNNGQPIFTVSAPTTLTVNGTPEVFTGPVCASATFSPLASQCKLPAIDPNYHEPFAGEWNLDIQRAITNNLSLEVAYIGNHGFDEPFQFDLDEPALGAGYTPAVVSACLASKPLYNKCKANTTAEVGNYSAEFPYFNYISEFSNGDFSNYNGLQITAIERVSHGLSFVAGYTFSHALDVYYQTGGGIPLSVLPNNPGQDYATSDDDIRNRFTFAPTYLIPGIRTPGQMLEGWSVSSIILMQGGLPWFPADKTTDLQGNGERKDGAIEYWNYTGPPSAFTSSATPIPCWGNLPGCTPYVGGQPPAQCMAAAQANGPLAIASLVNLGCYAQNGGVLTPAAYGTIGDAHRGIFRGPAYYNVDLSVAKIWKFRERYSAQFRAEFFNLFNRADLPIPAVTDPNKGLSGGFGYATSTPDVNNPVLGSGGPRHIQFGLKLTF